jgi:hypothetical protein
VALLVSQNLASDMLNISSIRSFITGGRLVVYSGAIPLTVDEAPGTELITFVSNLPSQLLEWSTSALTTSIGERMRKQDPDVWRGISIANGRATYFRWLMPIDPGGVDPGEPVEPEDPPGGYYRFQGEIGTSGYDFNMRHLDIIAGSIETLRLSELELPRDSEVRSVMATAVVKELLLTKSLHANLNNGRILIYDGTMSSRADSFVTNNILAQIDSSDPSGTLQMSSTLPAPGVLIKAADVWSGKVIKAGVATHFRYGQVVSNIFFTRFQGFIKKRGGDMNIPSGTTMKLDTVYTITKFQVENFSGK